MNLYLTLQYYEKNQAASSADYESMKRDTVIKRGQQNSADGNRNMGSEQNCAGQNRKGRMYTNSRLPLNRCPPKLPTSILYLSINNRNRQTHSTTCVEIGLPSTAAGTTPATQTENYLPVQTMGYAVQ